MLALTMLAPNNPRAPHLVGVIASDGMPERRRDLLKWAGDFNSLFALGCRTPDTRPGLGVRVVRSGEYLHGLFQGSAEFSSSEGTSLPDSRES